MEALFTVTQRLNGVCIGLLLLLGALQLPAQGVQWTAFADLPDSLRKAPRPLLIFIHTDWCKYCALQDHNTFGNEMVVRIINEKYYALRLNAEEKAPIDFLNRTYQGAGEGYHQLATFLAKTEGQLIFPTTVMLSARFQVEKRWTGFLSAAVLKAYGEHSR